MAYLDEGGALVGEARGRLPVAARFGEVLPVGGQPEQTRPPTWRLDLPRLRAAAARQHLVARVARQREQHAEALEQEPAVRRVRVLRMFQSDPIRSDPIRPIRYLLLRAINHTREGTTVLYSHSQYPLFLSEENSGNKRETRLSSVTRLQR